MWEFCVSPSVFCWLLLDSPCVSYHAAVSLTQGRAIRARMNVCQQSNTHRPESLRGPPWPHPGTSFLFKTIHYLYISSPSEDGLGLTSVLCASLCLIYSRALELALVCLLNCKRSSSLQCCVDCQGKQPGFQARRGQISLSLPLCKEICAPAS